MTFPKVIRGRAWTFGANIDTDQIIPAKYAIYSLDEKELGKHAMEGVPGRETWASLVTASFTASSLSELPSAFATRWMLRPVATTSCPAASAAFAMSRPMPRPAPVMNQTLLTLNSCL